MTLGIAMWSGPRNISTALMRSWENRDDCEVVDEPLYGHYLRRTGLDHPGADEVMAAQPRDWPEVTQSLAGAGPRGCALWYQKHMTHHMLPEVGREWMANVKNVFLLRDPAEVAASYVRTRAQVTLDDLGLPQQWELFQYVTEELGQEALVLDSKDILRDPEALLSTLCAALGVPFSPRMLHWPAGSRDSDGVWAPHWYRNVVASTGFQAYRPRDVRLEPSVGEIAEAGRVFYDRLYPLRLRAG